MKKKSIPLLFSLVILLAFITSSLPLITVTASQKIKTANQLAKSISYTKWANPSSSRRDWSWEYPSKDVKKYNARYNMGKKKEIYLTFDVGYSTNSTWKILRILKKQNIKAIFFVTYPVAKDEKKLIKRIIKDGHILGNHSTKHGDYSKLSLSATKNDFLKIHNYVLKTYHYRMEYFRFPEGAYSNRALYFMKQMKYKTVFWDFAYLDYDEHRQPSASYALSTIKKNLHRGSIPLLHGQSSTNATVLNRVIQYGKKKGYTFKQFEVSDYAGIQS